MRANNLDNVNNRMNSHSIMTPQLKEYKADMYKNNINNMMNGPRNNNKVAL